MRLGQRTKPEIREPRETRRRILDHARQAFNERGVAGVGVREIARTLALSPGNVSYHFPTKEALVAALIEEAHAENNALVDAPAISFDFAEVDRIIRAIMLRDLENQWLTRDFVGILAALPSLQSLHQQMQRAREARVDTLVTRLIDSGSLDARVATAALPELRRHVLTQVFFWLPAAIIEAPDRDPGELLDAYARATLALFRAYCTPAGRRDLEAVLATDAAAQRPGRKKLARRR